MLLSKQSSNNKKNFNNQLKVCDENINEHLSDRKKNFIMLNNNDNDNDYNANFDNEFTKNINM